MAFTTDLGVLPRRRRIGFLLFDGVKMLDFVGPAEVFQEANQRVDGYEMVMLSPDGADVTSSMGVVVGVQASAAEAGELDLLIVPGSEGAPGVYADPAFLEVLTLLIDRSRRVASICSGAFALAATGLLDGRTATTHWKFADALAARYPAIDVQADSIFTQDGRIFTSAGVAAGIDLALAIVEEDHGAEIARAVAQLLLVYMKRSGGQSQFSASLKAEAPRTPVAKAVVDYVSADPTRPTSATLLARHAKVSTRHLARVIRDELGMSPLDYVNTIRVDISTGLLESGFSVAETAAAAGFSSPVSLRRAFVARLGVTPSEYQRKFQTTRRAGAGMSRVD